MLEIYVVVTGHAGLGLFYLLELGVAVALTKNIS